MHCLASCSSRRTEHSTSGSARSPRKSCDLSCHTLTLALETYQLCLCNLALNSTLPYLALYAHVLIENLTDLSVAVKPRTGMRAQSGPIRFSPLNSPSNYFGRRFGRQRINIFKQKFTQKKTSAETPKSRRNPSNSK